MFEYKNPSNGIKVTLVDKVNPVHQKYHTISNVPLVLKVDDQGYIRNIGVIGEAGNLIPIFGGRFYGGFQPEFTPNYTPAKDSFNRAKGAKSEADGVMDEITELENKIRELKTKAQRFGFDV